MEPNYASRVCIVVHGLRISIHTGSVALGFLAELQDIRVNFNG
jgi:hypothetical protein